MALLTKTFGNEQTRWATIVIQYETNNEGKVSKPCTGTLKGIRLAKKDVQSLKAINQSTKIGAADFYVNTDNEQMQAKAFTAITKDGQPNALWRNNKVNEIDKEADSEEVEVKGVWDSKDIIKEAWELIEDVMNSIASEHDVKYILSVLNGEDNSDDVDNSDDDEWEEAEVSSKPKTKTAPKKKEELDDLEEID